MIDRRALIAATPALLATPALAASSKDIAVRGSKAYSESIMVMSVAADGSSALTLRFCRFPVEGFTWLWCHILHEGQLYAFTSHDLPCGPERLADGAKADYRATPLDAALSRVGKGRDLADVRISAALPFHKSRSAPHGPGAAPGKFTGQFFPVSPLGAQVLEGRDEVYGLCHADIEIGGRRLVHEGLAKFHEQRQENPRFEAPFCYSWLAGDAMASTALLHAKGASGGWQIDGVETALTDMTLDRPGDDRRVTWKMKDKPALSGRLKALVRYEIPVYDSRWNGSFVQGTCDGRPIVGAMNDWVVDPDIYAAALMRTSQS
ncbi:MAG: hypothetical protein KKE02_02370 [Alphaproteobacteria bacterium]|nr:hypothetical protein [Alphaproteobacteria bacterium]MBU1513478.1 hypothetical protein [Alphaproteobacteria bacterium]MBU2096470.1 hypothetical protein [Alphaproteobacteria bacterium]MBU2149838.1 hypothetical protein [Alphaproteobacteria bacterium]MBU2308256.1 hypothetical protein [Alphaproteobacteria bacterium]